MKYKIMVKCQCTNCKIQFQKTKGGVRQQNFCTEQCYKKFVYQKSLVDVQCEYCKNKFKIKKDRANKTNGLYCSLQCRKDRIYQKYQTGQLKKCCGFCGKDVQMSDKLLRDKKRQQMFCHSGGCKQKFMLRENTVKCQVCAKQFLKSQSERQRTTVHICSKQCRSQFNNKQVQCKCKLCKKKFMRAPSKIQDKQFIFCTNKCRNKFVYFRSSMQVLAQKILKQNGVKIITNQRKIAYPYQLDIYIPQMNLALQVNGIFHFKEINGPQTLARVQFSDEQKKIICKSKGIRIMKVNVASNDKKVNIRRIKWAANKIVRLYKLSNSSLNSDINFIKQQDFTG